MCHGSLWQKLNYLVFQAIIKLFKNKPDIKNNWFKRFRKVGLVFSEYWQNDPFDFNSQGRNLIVYGKFENPVFFDGIRSVLQREFTPRHAPIRENGKLYDILRSCNSVCIHIRRGDFLSDEFRKDFYVCDNDYYNTSIRIMLEKVESPVFFFCSNDIEWVKSNIKVDAPCYYEPSDNPLWETFRMMCQCKHFIISNSTLSWWAQYLSENEDKIVISPDHWYNNPEMNKHARLISDNFLKIHTDRHN